MPSHEWTEGLHIREAQTTHDYQQARRLFEEYATELEIDLCFQNFDQELRSLDQTYAPPGGCLLLAHRGGGPVGCVGLRPFEDALCEMKRLYVRPEARQAGLGRELARQVIARARRLRYRRIVLDTLESMTPARALYSSLGFRETTAYYPNPLHDAVYMALDLANSDPQRSS